MSGALRGNPHDLPRLPDTVWEFEADAVWALVEQAAVERWNFAIKAAAGLPPGPPLVPGWLTAPLGRRLEAAGVPIGRIFTACRIWYRAALAERAGTNEGAASS